MAAKVNVKFIGGLVVVLAAAVLIVGVLFFLQYKGDTERNIRAGDEAYAMGQYRVAKDMYGRAVAKDPTSKDYLVKYEDALLKITPSSADEAAELYSEWISVLVQDALYRGLDPKTHLRVLDEMTRRALLLEQDAFWVQLAEAATKMESAVPTTDPDHVLSRRYRGFANMNRLSVLTETEASSAEADLLAVIEARPDDDIAWSSLLALQRGMADKLRAQGRSVPFQDQLKKVQQTLEQGRMNVPNGLRFAMSDLRTLLYRRSLAPSDVEAAEIENTVERCMTLAESEKDRLVLIQFVLLMREADPTNAYPVAIDMLEAVVKDDPQAIFERLTLARQYLIQNKHEEALRYANSVVAAPEMNVSLVSMHRFLLQRDAARVAMDVELRLWDRASEAEKPAQFARVQAARQQLGNHVTSQSDPVLDWADGRIALIQGDFATAASKFESYLKVGAESDLETILMSAKALEEIKEYGLAYSRVRRVSDAVPNNVPLLVHRARLEFNIGRRTEAEETLKRAEQLEPGSELVASLRQAMAEHTSAGAAQLSANEEVNQLLTRAREAVQANDLETARESLQLAASKAPQDLAVKKLWFNIEASAGNLDRARELATEALAIAPNDPELLRVKTMLEHDDQVEAVKEVAAASSDTEAGAAVATLINLRALAEQQRSLARTHRSRGNQSEADQSQTLADRADAEADTLQPRALELAPNDATLIEHLFVRATAQRNWDDAERMVSRASSANTDRVGGALYKGRLALARANYAEAVTSLVGATQQMDYSSYAWRLLGMAYEGAGNIADAQRAYQRSYECNPNDLATLRIFTNLLVRIGDTTRAITIMRGAVTMLPDTSAAVEYWLGLEAEHGDLSRVLLRRREMYERSKDNVVNALQLALLLGQVEPRRDLIVDSSGNPLYPANRWDRMRAEEQQQILNKTQGEWLDQSEAILNDLERKGVRGLAAVNIRARNALARNNAAHGEKLLRDFIAQQEQARTLDVGMLLTLGQFLVDARRFEQALDAFTQARSLQDPVLRQADAALGEMFFRGSRFEQAAEAYVSVLEGGENLTIRQRLVECYIKTRQFDRAAEAMAKLKESKSGEYVNAMLEAAIAEGRGMDLYAAGKRDEAAQAFGEQRASLQRAMSLAPSQPMPHVQQAVALLNEFKRTQDVRLLESALVSLDSAAKLQSDFPAISIARADVLLAQGKLDAATGELGRLLKIMPESIPVRRRLIELYLDAGRLNEAGNVLLEATTRFPESGIWFERFADLKVMMGDVNAAEPMYANAYAIEPSRQLLAKLATARLRSVPPKPRDAVELLAKHEQDVQADPVLRGLLAEALALSNRPMDAMEQMRLGYAKFRSLIDAKELPPSSISQWYIQLRKLFRPEQTADAERFVRETAGAKLDLFDKQWIARIWIEAGPEGVRRAIEIQNEVLSECPPENTELRYGLLNDLALFYMRASDTSRAIEVMEQLIADQPQNPTVLNNLAYLLAKDRRDVKKAVQYAKMATEQKPNDPNIMDTYGFALMLDDQFAEAENVLRASIDILPLASTHLHLAQLYVKTNQPRYKIENALRRAEELNPDAETRAEIQALLDDMR